jgi:hypothetical protein
MHRDSLPEQARITDPMSTPAFGRFYPILPLVSTPDEGMPLQFFEKFSDIRNSLDFI